MAPINYMSRALTGYQRVLGDDHPDTLESMNNLAAVRQDLGDLYSANELYERALTARRRILGDDHPDTQASIKSLTEVRRALDEL
jgi:hypothetical protein